MQTPGLQRAWFRSLTGVYHPSSGTAKGPGTCYPVGRVRTGSSLPPVSTLIAVLVVLTGCGRRATHADCQLIVDRSVELRLRGQDETDPKVVAKREVQVRAELDSKISSCESRRVTDKDIACVKAATNSDELEACLK